MRHRIAKKTLNRTSAHRASLIKNLSEQIIVHGKIETTIDKAKFVKPYIEKLITKSKNTDTTDKLKKFNLVKYLKTKLFTDEAIKKLIVEVAPSYKDRQGGYTKIVRTGNRDGDNAIKARIELVTNETKMSDKEKLVAKATNK